MRRMVVLVVATVAVATVGLASCTPRPRHDFVVTSGDGVDAAPGDGVCEITAGSGYCTLRAAVQEANALAAAAPAPLVVTVTLEADVTLALAGAAEDLAATGDLDLDVATSEVQVHGGGYRVAAAGLDRAFDVHAGTVLLDQVVVTGGRSVGPGGGMRTAVGTSVGVVNSTFVDNRALVPGACFTAYFLGLHCVVGGVVTPGGTEPIGGGAIANGGRLVAFGSTFEANGADSNAPPCEFGSPQWLLCPATWGGAIQSTGELFVSASTFVGNDALAPLGGEVILERFGSAIHATGPSQVVSSTVVAGSLPIGAVAAATVQNSIVVSPSCGAPVIDANHNLRSPSPCGTPAPAGLGDLKDNGGPTRTILPGPTSTAVDAIAWEDCLGLTVDQRGEPRSEGQSCDIGAVERKPTDP